MSELIIMKVSEFETIMAKHEAIEDALRKQLEIAVEALKRILGDNDEIATVIAVDALAEIERLSQDTNAKAGG